MLDIARVVTVAGIVLASAAGLASAAEVLVEAEAFAERGGWVVDQQFVDKMGSPYLLAHGMGKPVADARTTVTFPAAGTYRVHVRTKDWVPSFADGPGRFRVSVAGKELARVFGCSRREWGWEDGGTVEVPAGEVDIALHDLSGFEGRCDAIYFTTTRGAVPPNALKRMTPWRRRLLGLPETPPSAGEFDLVVVGGGISGCSAAIQAARLGLTVALIHDRPWLGGNASQEVRVHTLGESDRIVREIDTPHYPNGSAKAAASDRRRHAVVEAEKNIKLFMEWRAFASNTEGGRITSVDARRNTTGEEKRFAAPVFVDATGDGWIGYWAGAEYMKGREDRKRFGESMAPERADNMTMGNSVLWNSYDTGAPAEFPDVPWAMDVAKGHSATAGEWYWEYAVADGLDTIEDAEEMRDHLFRAIYGSFRNAKKSPKNANRALKWVAYVAGKRESRRLVGDVILTEQMVIEHPEWPDAVVHESRDIDIHYPKKVRSGVDFLSLARFTRIKRYWIPFRCLYSKNIENLMMAGRCLSATHVGLGSPRVMNTCGQMGVAVGCAAYVCKERSTTPRGVYEKHLDELMRLVRSGEAGGGATEGEGRGIVVDTEDARGVVVTGDWQTSSHERGHVGRGYLHDGNRGKGRKSVTFTPEIPEAGRYIVEVRYTSSNSRAGKVPVDVMHSGGKATVKVDQRRRGGEWVRLGEWRFDAGARGSVTIRTDGTSGHVIADAVRFVPVAAE
jgi:hypothetical protein